MYTQEMRVSQSSTPISELPIRRFLLCVDVVIYCGHPFANKLLLLLIVTASIRDNVIKGEV